MPSVPHYEERLGRYLAAHTAPGEPIQVWDWEPSVYYFADRPCATRFGHNWAIVLTQAHLPELHRAYVAEFLNRLESVRPLYFADGARIGQSLHLSPEVEGYVLSHYHEVATFELNRIFERDPGQRPAPNGRRPASRPGKAGG